MAFETIAKFEGLKLESYQDSVGIWTVGYGNTVNLDTGMPIKKGDKISKETAIKWLNSEISFLQDRIKKLVKVPINQNQLDAITSLVYNIGIGAFSKSTLLRLLNANASKIEVAAQFLRWNKAGGKVLPGLTNRRQSEHNLFLK